MGLAPRLNSRVAKTFEAQQCGSLRVIFAWEFPPFEMASLSQTDGKSNLEFWVPGRWDPFREGRRQA
jgi:hypothetical protein